MTDPVMPTLLVDREEPQRLLESMVSAVEGQPARVLVVIDRSQEGKTSLLRRLRLNCRDQAVPAFLFDLKGASSPFDTLERWRAEDPATHLREIVPTYIKASEALIRGDFDSVLDATNPPGADIRNQVSLPGAEIRGGVIAAEAVVHIHNAPVTIDQAPKDVGNLTPAQRAEAQRRCVEAFLTDMQRYARKNPLVLLFDHFEDTTGATHSWIDESLVAPICRSPSPVGGLRLVLAACRGRSPADGYRARAPRVLAIGLEPIVDPELVRNVLVVNQIADSDDLTIDYLVTKMKSGAFALGTAITVARHAMQDLADGS